MLRKLQEHWGINGFQFIMVLVVFAITGTFTAWISRQITIWISTDAFSLIWWILKSLVFIIGYPLFLITFAALLGQFTFFWKFEKKLLKRLGFFNNEGDKKFRIAIFASGAGSNAVNIIRHYRGNPQVSIEIIVCNKPGAGVLEIASENNIDVLMITRDNFREGYELIEELKKRNIDLVVLAGFLWKLPPPLIHAFPRRIINIHPALLPNYGGKGMYGAKVHEAVINNGEKQSGITIHYVDEVYDNGEIIFQANCEVNEFETPATLAEKIHALEHMHFPKVIDKVIEKQNHR